MIALYVLGALLLLLLVGVMLAPLMEDAEPAVELERLPPGDRREAALEALRDVEFEFETGKLAEGEYRRLRAHFGRAVLEAEEAMTGSSEGNPDGEAGPSGEVTTAYCTSCGGELRPGARFCPACGEPRAGASEPEAASDAGD